MSKQTAVQWYWSKIKSHFKHDGDLFEAALMTYSIAREKEREQSLITEDTSDGYHTFKTLYEIRKAYNVALFNEWGKYNIPSYNVHKSRRHHDGLYPFGNENWFIVCAELPTGQISNHYTMDNWDLFKIPETEKALFPFDGHTTEDVIQRLLSIR
jgi:hypothetical protein